MSRRRERRSEPQRQHRVLWDLFFRSLRGIYGRAHSFGATLGLFLVAGTLVAAMATFGFAHLAREVAGGDMQAFDEAVLRWIELHHSPALDAAMIEISMLGTGVVVLMIVGVAGLFLYLT